MTAGSSVPEAARAAVPLSQMDNVFREGTPRQMKWVDALHRANFNSFTVNGCAEILMDLADHEIERAVAAASVGLQQEVDRLSAECEALRGTVAEERATTGQRIEAALALCQDANGYTTHDQIEKLGEPPWRGMDANLIAWEQAHGHDVRLGCDRTECLLLIDPEDIRAALASPGEES